MENVVWSKTHPFLWFFGAHLGIPKIRACLVLAIMLFFFLFLCILGFVLKEI